MIRGFYRHSFITAAGPRPTLRGIAGDRSAMVFITLPLLGFAALLVYVTAGRLEMRSLSHESTAWPKAPGTVLDARAVWSSTPRSGHAYWPTVRYRYSVHGIPSVGNRVSFRTRYGRTEAEHAAARYPPRSAVAVAYRPEDPQTSVLEPGTWDGRGALAFLVPVTVVAVVVGIASLWVLLFVSKPRLKSI